MGTCGVYACSVMASHCMHIHHVCMCEDVWYMQTFQLSWFDRETPGMRYHSPVPQFYIQFSR